MWPARAPSAAATQAATKASMSLMRWSAATTRATVPGARRSARQAATATAAAESRRIGSSAISASTPTAWSCSATMKRTSLEAMTSGFRKAGSAKRLAVTWKLDRSSSSGMNCFGMLSRDAGHSRVPEPPHMITGRILADVGGMLRIGGTLRRGVRRIGGKGDGHRMSWVGDGSAGAPLGRTALCPGRPRGPSRAAGPAGRRRP